MKKVLFISSGGGHLSELLQLQPLFTDYNYLIVTEKTSSTLKLKEQYGKRVKYLVYGARNYLFSYLFKFSFNILKSLVIFAQFRPDVVVTTGAHTAVPLCFIAKFFGKRIIYIESFARVRSRSMAGSMIYRIADTFFVQHETMLEAYPEARYEGALF